MIFYKKIGLNHLINMTKSYMYLGNYIIETQITIKEETSCSKEENENSQLSSQYSEIKKM